MINVTKFHLMKCSLVTPCSLPVISAGDGLVAPEKEATTGTCGSISGLDGSRIKAERLQKQCMLVVNVDFIVICDAGDDDRRRRVAQHG